MSREGVGVSSTPNRRFSMKTVAMLRSWKEGDRVKVYEDPYTRKRLEGLAVVKRINRSRDGALHNAAVLFDGDAEDQVVTRWVHADDLTD